MDCQNSKIPIKRFLLFFLIAAIASIIFGCGYLNFFAYKAHWGITYKGIPSMSALNNLAPQESLVVGGQIIKPHEREEPLLLIAVSSRYRLNEIVARVQLQKTIDSTTYYMAFLPKGEYRLYIFADLDKNNDFESDEVVGQTTVRVTDEQSIAGAVIEGPPITLNFEHRTEVDFRVNENVRQNSYVYSSLDDTFFDPKYGKLGLYNPTELISHTQGFLFGLEEVDPKKALVLFIHGISGTPRDWKFLVEGLDRNRFQPFFFYYPTGLPLDKLGTLLGQIITIISKTPKGRNRPIILAAHSMGGLVALSAIQKLTQEGLPSSLKLFCSFATPYAGDDSARYWGDKAPTMVPAWRDIATGSDFIQDLTRRSITSKLPFYLFFAYHDASTIKNAKNSDGAVTIHSQLNPAIQSAAAKVLGFNETHTGILNSEAARQSFHQLLDSVVPPKHAPIRNHE